MQNPQDFPTMMVTAQYRPSGHRRAIKWLIGISALVIALFLGLLTLLLISGSLLAEGGDAGPIAILTGLTLATIPVPIYVMLVLWLDRYEAEPFWLLGSAFLWGASVAAFGSFLINTVGQMVVGSMTQDSGVANTFGAVVSAPLVEESLKGMALFIIYFWKKDEFDGVVDGVVYAAMVGLGFAMTENVMYYGRGMLGGAVGGAVVVFLLRGLMAPFSHPLFTSMTGIGLGLARQSSSRALKFIAPVVGLGLAIAMHAIWNGSASFGGGLGFFLTYIFFMVPVFVGALIAVFFALKREGRIVRENLQTELQRGLFTPDEFSCLCSIRGRMGASFRALQRGGISGWRCRMEWHQVASELAFHRSRITRGVTTWDHEAREREATYLALLQEMRVKISSF